MGNYGKTIKSLLEIFEDGKLYSIKDLEKILEDDYEIDLSGENGKKPLYTSLHRLKKQGKIRRTKNCYRICLPLTDREFEEAIEIVEAKIKMYKNFEWYNCSDEELAQARYVVKKITDLSKHVQNLMKLDESSDLLASEQFTNPVIEDTEQSANEVSDEEISVDKEYHLESEKVEEITDVTKDTEEIKDETEKNRIELGNLVCGK